VDDGAGKQWKGASGGGGGCAAMDICTLDNFWSLEITYDS